MQSTVCISLSYQNPYNPEDSEHVNMFWESEQEI